MKLTECEANQSARLARFELVDLKSIPIVSRSASRCGSPRLTHEHLKLHHQRFEINRSRVVKDAKVVAEVVSSNVQGSASLLATNSGSARSVTGDVGNGVGRSDIMNTKKSLWREEGGE